MKDYKFYVKNENQSENIYMVNLSAINKLAMLAITLECEDEMTEALGYATALDTFMYNNKDHDLYDIYKTLHSASDGIAILIFSIELSLMEQYFRLNGINDDSKKSYNIIQEQYNKILINNIKEKNDLLSGNRHI